MTKTKARRPSDVLSAVRPIAEKIAAAVRNEAGSTVIEKRDEMRREKLIADLAAEMAAHYRADTDALELGRPDAEPLASETMEPIIALIAELIERGHAYLRDYYAFTGGFVEQIVAANPTSPAALKDFVRGYEEAGCDELVLFSTTPGLEQLEQLQEALA